MLLPIKVARGDNGPWTGVAFHQGAFYVTGGGQTPGPAAARWHARRNGAALTAVR